MEHRQIMMLANKLIDALEQCDDCAFADYVTDAVWFGDKFSDDEMCLDED